jgi:hypothetical protein
LDKAYSTDRIIGYFTEKTARDYKSKSGSYWEDTVDYWIKKSDAKSLGLYLPPKPSKVLPILEGSSSSPDYAASILYMDVGAWIGNGGDPNKNWSKKRYFGMIYKTTAALCTHTYKTSHNANYHSLPNEMKALFDDINLGPQTFYVSHVLKIPQNTFYRMVNPNFISVFLGDTHFPIITDPSRRKIGARIGVTGGPLFGSRSGRIDDFLNPTVPLPSNYREWPGYGRMREDQEDAWYKFYTGRDLSSNPVGLPADIFQNAGNDLEDFCERLVIYNHKANTPSEQLVPIRLVQLGDMFDFWIGLVRFFDKGMTNNPSRETGINVVCNDVNTKKFVEYWANETLGHTSQSASINGFLGYAKMLNAQYAYGNHDNYLNCFDLNCLDSFGRKITIPRRNRVLLLGYGIYAEHGHQSDEYNMDGATGGWVFTQFAFRIPSSRKVEDDAKKLFGGVGDRLERMGYAADRCLWHKTRTSVYVMGHTHEPFLKQIIIRTF